MRLPPIAAIGAFRDTPFHIPVVLIEYHEGH